MFPVDLAKACCRVLTPELFGYMVWGTGGAAHSFLLSSQGFSSVSTAGVLLLIFMCLNIFNHDLYKLKRSPHFLLSLQKDIESHSPEWGFILSFQVWTLRHVLKSVCKCLLRLVKQHKKTELKYICILFLNMQPVWAFIIRKLSGLEFLKFQKRVKKATKSA